MLHVLVSHHGGVCMVGAPCGRHVRPLAHWDGILTPGGPLGTAYSGIAYRPTLLIGQKVCCQKPSVALGMAEAATMQSLNFLP